MEPTRSSPGIRLGLSRQSRETNIASYRTDSLHLNFKQRAGRLFAERVAPNKPAIQHSLHSSVFKIEAIPTNLDQPGAIRWLLDNQYFPEVQKREIVFEHHAKEDCSPVPKRSSGWRSVEAPFQGLPLHQAVHKGDTGAIHSLIAQGKDPNSIDEEGSTPLHVAAKRGQVESARVLIKAGARLDIANRNHSLPFDLAISFEQDDFIHSFLETPPQRRLNVAPPQSEDKEGYYSKCLLQAKRQGFLEEQIVYLQKIREIYLRKSSFVRSAEILNSAVALYQDLGKDHPLVKDYLFYQLELIEGLYLKNQGITQPLKKKKTIREYREVLQGIRQTTESSHNNQEIIQQILAKQTKDFKQLVVELIFESMDSLGPPPVKWACMGMGSMSRDEMCPYSDVEFAFVVETDSEEAMAYFRKLSKILELKMINFGETKFLVFGNDESATIDGFCIDRGGNTPLGVEGVYELIGTPKQLARFQEAGWVEARGVILSNAMSHVCLVAGDQGLVSQYIAAKEQIQQSQSEGYEVKNEEVLVGKLLSGHLEEFRPDLSFTKEQDAAYGIKKELYRPFQEILSSLAILFHLKGKTTFDRIDELHQRNIFSEQGATRLKQAFGQVLSLRLQAHLFYRDEKEFLCYPQVDGENDPTLLYMKAEHTAILKEIYCTLIPFHECSQEFYETAESWVFSQSDFFTLDPTLKATRFLEAVKKGKRTFGWKGIFSPYQASSADKSRYAEAEQSLQQALSLDPNNFTLHFKLAHAKREKGDIEGAIDRFKKALTLSQSLKEGAEVALIYDEIGICYFQRKEYEEALHNHNESLKMRRQIFGETHRDVATCYHNLAAVCFAQGKTGMSKVFAKLALRIRQEVLEKDHPDVLLSYRSLTLIHNMLGELKEANEYAKKEINASRPERIVLDFHYKPQLGNTLSPAPLKIIGKAVWDSIIRGEVDKEPPLPSDMPVILQCPCPINPTKTVGETHVLVLVPSKVNDEAITMQKLGELFQNPLKGPSEEIGIHYNWGCYQDVPPPQPYWILVHRSVLEGSCARQSGEAHDKMVTDLAQKTGISYVMPKVLEANIFFLIHFFMTGRKPYYRGGIYIIPFIRCQEFHDAEEKKSLVVGGPGDKINVCAYTPIGPTGVGVVIRSQQIDPSHPETEFPGFRTHYTSTYNSVLLSYIRDLEIQERSESKNLLDLATRHEKIGDIYQILGQHVDAIGYFQKCAAMKKESSTVENPSVAVAYEKIAVSYQSLKEYDKSFVFLNEAFALLCRVHQRPHPQVLTMLEQLINCGKRLSTPPQMLRDVYSLCNKFVGSEHELTRALLELNPALSNSDEHGQEIVTISSSAIIQDKGYPPIAVGKAELEKYLGFIGVENPLPSNIHAILSRPCYTRPDKTVGETHLLTYVSEQVNGIPLSLVSLEKLVKKPKLGKKTKFFFLQAPDYKKIPAGHSRWVLMLRDVIPQSRGMDYDAQCQLLKTIGEQTGFTFRVPTLLDGAVSIFMERIINGTYLFPKNPPTLMRCLEEPKGKTNLYIHTLGSYIPNVGLSISLCRKTDKNKEIGIAPCWELEC